MTHKLSHHRETYRRPFFVPYGMINVREYIIPKDDGFNTSIISADLVKKNRIIVNIVNENINIEHPNWKIMETSFDVVIEATIKIGNH